MVSRFSAQHGTTRERLFDAFGDLSYGICPSGSGCIAELEEYQFRRGGGICHSVHLPELRYSRSEQGTVGGACRANVKVWN